MIVTFWFNAFIPKTVSGYTQAMTSGTHAGKTAIPMPGAARILNPFKPLDSGFLTDQRSFDSTIGASVRMQSWAKFDVTPSGIVPMQSDHRTSGTTQVTIPTGMQTGYANADMSRCSWTPLTQAMRVFTAGTVHVPFGGNVPVVAGVASINTPTFSMRLVGQAGDPLISGAADIDYNGTLTVSVHTAGAAMPVVEVQFQGMLDDFPAFEAYANYGGQTKELFSAAPPPGNTVLNLLGGATRPISGRVQFP